MNKETQPAISADMGSGQFRDEIVGKRIEGVIARPGRDGQPPVVLMLMFEDGSVVEFISPRSDRLLRRAMRCTGSSDRAAQASAMGQLELMPMPAGPPGGHGLN
ncbi:MAG: hypothetical protein EA370_00450 [Wenzhouxiangella sp.]|nr:MAG: hypothetical protein EA370_00450 [Wenzhouxiangella sp.]